MDGASLPTFICIGAAKCGTTSLWRYLSKHPEICVSTPKETDFFLESSEKSEEWYRGCFKQEASAYGEFSTKYTKIHGDSGVPARMHDLLPDAKLLYLVRDPVERAISEYMHNAALGWETGTSPSDLEEALFPMEESWYLNVSRYYFQLAPYLEQYSKGDILVIQSERLREDRKDVMEKISHFIGVDPEQGYDRGIFTTEFHSTSDKIRRPKIWKIIEEKRIGNRVKVAIKESISRDTIKWIKTKIRKTGLLGTVGEKPALSGDVLSRIREYLQEDTDKLRELTGKRFQNWSV